MNRIEPEDVCTFEDGEVTSVDFSKILTLSREAERQARAETDERARNLCLVAPQWQRALPAIFTRLFPGLRNDSQLPVRRSDLTLDKGPGPAPSLSLVLYKPQLPAVKDAPKTDLSELPELKTYAVQTGQGFLGRGRSGEPIVIDIPFGMPRHVNAGTLKAMLGAGRFDPLLRKTRDGSGEHWQVCPNSYRVDLEDRTEIFRLGQLQIFS